VWLGHLAAVGFGATLAGQLSYISTGYNFSNSPHTGKVTGVWQTSWGIAFAFVYLFNRAFASNTVWALVGAIFTLLVAFAWRFQPAAAPQLKFREEVGFDRALGAFWKLFPGFVAVPGFYTFTEWATAQLKASLANGGLGTGAAKVTHHADSSSWVWWGTVIFLVAAALFFGWRFDLNQPQTFQIWLLVAWVAALFVLLNIRGYVLGALLWTSFISTIAFIGGQTSFCSHMLYQSFRNEASVSAAWVFLWGAGYMVAQFLFVDLSWTSETTDWIVIAVALLLTTFGVRGGLPSLNGVQYGVLRRSAGSVY